MHVTDVICSRTFNSTFLTVAATQKAERDDPTAFHAKYDTHPLLQFFKVTSALCVWMRKLLLMEDQNSYWIFARKHIGERFSVELLKRHLYLVDYSHGWKTTSPFRLACLPKFFSLKEAESSPLRAKTTSHHASTRLMAILNILWEFVRDWLELPNSHGLKPAAAGKYYPPGTCYSNITAAPQPPKSNSNIFELLGHFFMTVSSSPAEFLHGCSRSDDPVGKMQELCDSLVEKILSPASQNLPPLLWSPSVKRGEFSSVPGRIIYLGDLVGASERIYAALSVWPAVCFDGSGRNLASGVVPNEDSLFLHRPMGISLLVNQNKKAGTYQLQAYAYISSPPSTSSAPVSSLVTMVADQFQTHLKDITTALEQGNIAKASAEMKCMSTTLRLLPTAFHDFLTTYAATPLNAPHNLLTWSLCTTEEPPGPFALRLDPSIWVRGALDR